MPEIDFKEQLNDRQYEAVTQTDSPLLIIAGAGSGKTRVITYKIAWLLLNRLAGAENILAITFTNKAADEMNRRVESLLQARIRSLLIKTFHATGMWLLKRHIDRLGWPKTFTICDDADKRSLVRQCLDILGLDRETYPPEELTEKISLYKNTLRRIDTLFADGNERAVFDRYELLKKSNSALDFDDLLEKTVELFKSCPDLRELYSRRWEYILIDEYQDVNPLQYEFIRQVTDRKSRLTVVGDDDQCIYEWRGATPAIMERFESDYDGVRIVVLDRNYRSTKTVIAAASSLIQHNGHRRPKKLWTENEQGEPIDLVTVPHSFHEAKYLQSAVTALLAEGFNLRDIAVFYRTNHQSQPVESAFIENKTAYRVIGAIKFFERREIKDILSYFKVLVNTSDGQSLSRIINVPNRGIGPTTVKKLGEWAESRKMSLYDCLLAYEQLPVPAGQREKIRELSALLEELRSLTNSMNAHELAVRIIERTGYAAYLEKRPVIERDNRLESIEEFTNLLEQKVKWTPDLSVAEYIDELSLYSAIDGSDFDENRVSLITLHNAKGLEFPVVFILGCEDTLLPHRNSLEAGNVDEERRLFYVGITRAAKKLTLVNAQQRTIYGKRYFMQPSMFLKELPAELLRPFGLNERTNEAVAFSGRRQAGNRDEAAGSPYRPGDIVRHSEYGLGVVKAVEGEEDDAVVRVKFESGEKKFILKFAGLSRV